MSLFAALSSALSGLTSQSDALGNVSNNIANSQTVGYKRIDTSFIDYITEATATQSSPGAVVARPDYINTVEGTIAQSDNSLAMAISGAGFFPVANNISGSSAAPTFDTQQYYTRAGDFTQSAAGYLVNSSGKYLEGWPVNADGTLDTNTLAPVHISQSVYAPVPTGNVTLSANLPPANGTSTTAISSNVSVYDAQGQAHQLTLTFTPTTGTANAWSIGVTDDKANAIGSGTLTFNANGTLASITQSGGTVNTSGAPAQLALTTVYPTSTGGVQSINLNLGAIGSTTGLTQFAGSSYALQGLSQDGVPPGNFTNITTTQGGDIVANYDNGQSRRIARVPLITFAAPDALQSQNGAAFTETADSGVPLANPSGTNGTGTIITNSVEQSNVDLASQFSALIVAQQAYSANAKVVTTGTQMMQVTLDMKQ